MTDQGDNPVGRPTVMTEDIVNKLEECFADGASDVEACFIAGISKQTLYNYQKYHPEFVDRKEGLKSLTTYRAKKVVSQSIASGDKNDAKWHLERKDPEHNPRSNVNIGGQANNPIKVEADVNLSPSEAYLWMLNGCD